MGHFLHFTACKILRQRQMRRLLQKQQAQVSGAFSPLRVSPSKSGREIRGQIYENVLMIQCFKMSLVFLAETLERLSERRHLSFKYLVWVICIQSLYFTLKIVHVYFLEQKRFSFGIYVKMILYGEYNPRGALGSRVKLLK